MEIVKLIKSIWNLYPLFAILFYFSYFFQHSTNEESILFGIYMLICFAFIVFGRWLNLLVCDLNDGKMPFKPFWKSKIKIEKILWLKVHCNTKENEEYVFLSKKTRANFLADFIPMIILTRREFGFAVASIGDFFQWFGKYALILLIVYYFLNGHQ